MKTESLKHRRDDAGGKSTAIRADQRVVLKNGQPGTVQFVSATMKVARVRMADGKVRTVKLAEIVPAGSSRGGLDKLSRREVRLRVDEGGDSPGGDDFDDPAQTDEDIDPEEGFDEQDEFEAEDEAGLRKLLQHLLGLGSKKGEMSEEVEHVSADEGADDADLKDGGDDDLGDGHGHDDDENDEDGGGDHESGEGSDDEGDDDDHDGDHTSRERRKAEIRHTVERAHPVAGQRPVVSDRVARRAEKKISGLPKRVHEAEVEKIGRKDPESGRQVVQPSGSIRQNERLAAEAAPELETRLSRAAARVPGAKFVRLRPQKNPDRLRDKIRSEEKPAETISDYLASQISADSTEAKDRMIAQLKKHFKVVNVEDKFLQGRKEKAGYPSANVQVALSNGGTAEVQIVPREVQQATEQSHHFYKMGRNAKDAGKTALAKHYFDQATAINERALARFRMRNA